MPAKKAEPAEVVFATTVHVAADVATPADEQIDAAVRACFPGFDPERHSMEFGQPAPHPDGGQALPVTVVAAPPAPE